MRLRRILLGSVLAGCASATPIQVLHPCSPGSGAYAQASQELEAIQGAIQKLEPDTPVDDLVARLRQLTRSRCFQMLEDGVSLGDHPSARSLEAYWDGGGYQHLRGFLDLGQTGNVFISRPPTSRTVLGVDALPPGHPLSALVCPASDTACGVGTLGWALRAQEVFDARARSEQDRCRPIEAPATPAPEPDERYHSETCARIARQLAPPQQFRRYLGCLEDLQRTRKALPLGRLREPAEGWLTVAGPREPLHSCDELDAFDLASGTAISVARCPGGQAPAPKLGRVPVGAIRETAWMLAMLPAVQDRVALVEPVLALDPEIPRVLAPEPPARRGRTCEGAGSSSEDTHLTWQVRGADQILGTGVVIWPSDLNDDAAAHATSLLRIAEAAFVPGCPTATPPADLFVGDLEPLWRPALAAITACRRSARR
jgi:hypothetical protein